MREEIASNVQNYANFGEKDNLLNNQYRVEIDRKVGRKMIAKFRTQINATDSWTIISNIRSVDYWPVKKGGRQEENFKPDYYIQALDKYGKPDESLNREDYVWVTVIKDNNEVISFCSNMAIYLLNEEGKTIEHIH